MEMLQQVPQSQAEYVLHEDGGHAWLQVPMKEVRALGITVTPSSYQSKNGKIAFLEEDCDLSAFMRAKEARKEPVRYYLRRSNVDSFIRNLPRFKQPRGAQKPPAYSITLHSCKSDGPARVLACLPHPLQEVAELAAELAKVHLGPDINFRADHPLGCWMAGTCGDWITIDRID